MIVFHAMLVDAYRELKSKSLFWVVLGLSALVILVYASIGFNQNGMFLFFGLYKPESSFFSSDSPLSELLYRGIFTTFIVSLWLTWIATILALVSTSNAFPDFIASGAVDIVLSKPISRVRLFVYKYLVSLLFVVLQVAIFCVGVFLCMGWRIGAWDPKIFLAIPIVTLFFSYLYSFNVLVGVYSRSAMAALLFTMCLWFSVFGMNFAEGIFVQVRSQFEVDRAQAVQQKDAAETALAKLDPSAEDYDIEKLNAEQRIMLNEEVIERQDELLAKTKPWFYGVMAVKFPMPKTGETIDLLNQYLVPDGAVGLNDLLSGNFTQNEDGDFVVPDNEQSQLTDRVEAFYDERSLWYIIGTSLLFEAVMLTAACAIFVRRDY